MKDIINLVPRNVKEVTEAFNLLNTKVDNNIEVEEVPNIPIKQTITETPNVVLEVDIVEASPNSSSKELLENVLMEYEIIDTTVINSKNDAVKATDFKDKPQYIVSKGYTAKKKDEIHLPLGSEVCILDTKNDRSFVVVLDKSGQELDRGWIPTFCLQRKEDAVYITSKEGIICLLRLYDLILNNTLFIL